MRLVRRGCVVELWLGPENDPESELFGSWHYSYNNEVIAALKRFEQSEGRK